MKHLFTATACIFLLSAFPSCKKCGICGTVSRSVSYPAQTGYPHADTTYQQLCGKDATDVDGKTVITHLNIDTFTITVTSNTTCQFAQ